MRPPKILNSHTFPYFTKDCGIPKGLGDAVKCCPNCYLFEPCEKRGECCPDCDFYENGECALSKREPFEDFERYHGEI
jgi:hypothetical protein